MEIRKMYSPIEVAKLVGVSRRTVYRWVSEGKLRAVKAGERMLRISSEDLQAFIAKGTGEAIPADSDEAQKVPNP